jgi:ribosomal protein L11 methyltransferase
MPKRDYILAIPLDVADEETILARLYLTSSSGSTVQGQLVEAYFDTAEERDAALEAFADLEPCPVDRDKVDWLAHYQQSLTAMEIGTRFTVAPDASLLRDSSRMTIIVPQEQAFGTGSHETTALCIETLESLKIGRGLDIGSGSGILAIAMLRLGATKVIAFDNDPDAYGALRDNRIRNGIAAERMPLFIGSIEALRGGTFDVITMNIIPEVIVPLLPEVVPHVAGKLILSGILLIKRDEAVDAAATHGLRLVSERAKGEWWAGMFGRAAGLEK